MPLPPRLRRLPAQLARRSPFTGDIHPARIALFARGRPSLPFPHPWNHREPLRILETFFVGADDEADAGARHHRYLDVPGFAPVLVTRDPAVIRAISTATGDRPGQFDRDTLPSGGIARATGADTLLYANGAAWRRQKQLAAPPFAKSTLFQPETFADFEQTFRSTVGERLDALRRRIEAEHAPVRLALEPEIKALMLELLVACFFGASITPDEVRERFVPALDRVIDDIVRDTVFHAIGVPLRRLPALVPGLRRARADLATFEALVDRVLEPRASGTGQWGRFRSDAPDDALRSNVRVFLAGALEATTSYASWAIAHLARDLPLQDRLHADLAGVDAFTPEALAGVPLLSHVLDETLRLTPSLYFHPRRPTVDTTVETDDGRTLVLPAGTHVLLDVWHANRHDDHWGEAATGHRAATFRPERWDGLDARAHLHFGFGHGPRFCPGRSLGRLEVALVVGACVKLFRFAAVEPGLEARAGVSTKPADGVLVDLHPRAVDADVAAAAPTAPSVAPDASDAPSRCPFSGG